MVQIPVLAQLTQTNTSLHLLGQNRSCTGGFFALVGLYTSVPWSYHTSTGDFLVIVFVKGQKEATYPLQRRLLRGQQLVKGWAGFPSNICTHIFEVHRMGLGMELSGFPGETKAFHCSQQGQTNKH